MLRNFFIILFLLTQTIVFAQTRRALVIGIGEYKDSQWHRISSNNDVLVTKNYLKNNGFLEANIWELQNSNATFANIKDAFVKLANVLNNGDIAYIHFSAHGQQVTDLDGDEADGYDEAIVTYDAFKNYKKGSYEGQCHITDDSLYAWLSMLKDKVGDNGKIVVVNDACHSGDGSRNDDELIVRGTSGKFIIPEKTRQVSAKPKKLRWTYISACKSYQSNYEYVEPESGNSFGRLTYMIYLMYGLIGKCSSADEFSKQLKLLFEQMSDVPQTPEVESDRIDLPIF